METIVFYCIIDRNSRINIAATYRLKALKAEKNSKKSHTKARMQEN